MDLVAENMIPALIGAGITLLIAGIGFVVWLVRLEGKTNANAKDLADFKLAHDKEIADLKSTHAKELVDLKADYDCEIRDLKADIRDTRERHFKHVADVVIHHNAEATLEFRTALERRFSGMEDSLKDIGRKLNHIAGRE